MLAPAPDLVDETTFNSRAFEDGDMSAPAVAKTVKCVVHPVHASGPSLKLFHLILNPLANIKSPGPAAKGPLILHESSPRREFTRIRRIIENRPKNNFSKRTVVSPRAV